jgi:hypothetical protein
MLEVDELERLLITRCLMNFGGLYLTDIDAVGRTAEGQLEFIEFKRKDAARGRDAYKAIPAPSAESASWVYLEQAAQLRKRFNPLPRELKGAGKDESSKKIRQAKADLNRHLAQSGCWQKAAECDCFGLDESHARTVQLAAIADMGYRYIIWNSSESDPNKLFTGELLPSEAQDLVFMLVKPRHFDRITKTVGPDSGTYTSKIRFQLLIPVQDNFRPLVRAAAHSTT